MCEMGAGILMLLQPRQNLLNAASRVGEASHAVLYTIGEEDEADTELQVGATLFESFLSYQRC